MAEVSFTPELQHLEEKFEDQFRIVDSSDIAFIRRVAGQIAIEGL